MIPSVPLEKQSTACLTIVFEQAIIDLSVLESRREAELQYILKQLVALGRKEESICDLSYKLNHLCGMHSVEIASYRVSFQVSKKAHELILTGELRSDQVLIEIEKTLPGYDPKPWAQVILPAAAHRAGRRHINQYPDAYPC